MSTKAIITNQLTLVYSGIKDPEGGMLTEWTTKNFTDEVFESEWIAEKIRQINTYPEHWGACYTFKRV